MSSTHITQRDNEADRRIREILEASTDPEAAVSVAVKGTCAVLKGAVRSWAEHEAAERAALSIPGVTTVDNQIALLVKAKLAAR